MWAILQTIGFIAAILSLVIGYITYNKGIHIQEENNKIILENLLLEIEMNVEKTEYFLTNIEGYREKPETPNFDFISDWMEQSLSFIEDSELRRTMTIAIEDIKALNYLISAMRGMPAPIPERTKNIEAMNKTSISLLKELDYIHKTLYIR